MIYLIAGALVACVTAGGVSGLWGYSLGKDSAYAAQKRAEEMHTSTLAKANLEAAHAIAALREEHDARTQQLQKELQSKPVYRDCKSGPAAVRLFNAAKAPAGTPGAKPTGGSRVPGKSDARR